MKSKLLKVNFFYILIFLMMMIYICISLFFTKRSPKYPIDEENYKKKSLQFIKELEKINISRKQESYNLKDYNQLNEKAINVFKNKTLMKRILYWYQPWGSPVKQQILPPECGKCEVTDDTSKLHDPSTAALLFHISELNPYRFPAKRNPKQLYVYYTMEGPQYIRYFIGRNLSEFNKVFNLTMSYRRDSDIFSSYGTMSHVLDQLKQKYKDTNDSGISATLKMKTRFAVWIVSNCGMTPGARERLDVVEEMVKSGIPVDRRGKCFPKNEPPPGKRADRGNGDQLKFFSESKFILSFENSHNCKDYFTEKLFWNGFIAGAVPIIWGAPKEDYEKVIPPHSAIFLDDYPNLKDLAAYLNYLDKNKTAYREYFEWRLMDVEEMSDYGRQTSLCQLCRIVHGVNIDNLFAPNVPRLQKIPLFGFPKEPRIVKSIHEWEFGDKNKRCFEFSQQFDGGNPFSLLSILPASILRWYYRIMYPS